MIGKQSHSPQSPDTPSDLKLITAISRPAGGVFVYTLQNMSYSWTGSQRRTAFSALVLAIRCAALLPLLALPMIAQSTMPTESFAFNLDLKITPIGDEKLLQTLETGNGATCKDLSGFLKTLGVFGQAKSDGLTDGGYIIEMLRFQETELSEKRHAWYTLDSGWLDKDSNCTSRWRQFTSWRISMGRRYAHSEPFPRSAFMGPDRSREWSPY